MPYQMNDVLEANFEVQWSSFLIPDLTPAKGQMQPVVKTEEKKILISTPKSKLYKITFIQFGSNEHKIR